MCISTTTLTSSPSGSTAAGQKQEACSSTGSLSKPSPSDRPRTTPSSATLILPGRPPHWSEGDTLFLANALARPRNAPLAPRAAPVCPLPGAAHWRKLEDRVPNPLSGKASLEQTCNEKAVLGGSDLRGHRHYCRAHYRAHPPQWNLLTRRLAIEHFYQRATCSVRSFKNFNG